MQAALNVFVAVLLLTEINNAHQHGQELANPGLLGFALVLSFVVAGAQAICAFLLPRRVPWVRVLAIGVEVVTIGSGLLGFVNGGAPQGVMGVGLPVLALVFLVNHEMTTWFARR